MIEGLRVMPRTSVEQYRENKKSAKEIGEELGVSYLIEGSFLMVNDHVKLTIQLVVAEEGDHIFFREYDRNYSDIIAVQSEVAQTIAGEIEVAITPEEKQRIEKIPTTSLTAYDFYQKGSEECWRYRTDPHNLPALDKAEEQYKKALSYDSHYGQAYLGLAMVFWEKNLSSFSENYMDSALVLVNKALLYDNTLAEAYIFKGDYFREDGLREQALKEYERALDFNPNSWKAYRSMGKFYYEEDMVAGIDNLHKAISMNQGRELPDLLGDMGGQFDGGGFFEIARNYYQEKLILDNDSIAFMEGLAAIASNSGNHVEAEKYLRKVFAADSFNISVLFELGQQLGFLGQYKESLIFLEKWLAQLDIVLVRHRRYNGMHRVGYAYWKNERYEEAEYYFDRQLEICNLAIVVNHPYAQFYYAYYDRAGIYAFRGEKEKAFDDLRIFNQLTNVHTWMIQLIKIDPLFDSIRDEPEFQQIVRDVEAKYQAEHKRVRQWLEKNDML